MCLVAKHDQLKSSKVTKLNYHTQVQSTIKSTKYNQECKVQSRVQSTIKSTTYNQEYKVQSREKYCNSFEA